MQTINPYTGSVGAKHAEGLAAIASGLVSNMAFPQLNQLLYGYIKPIYYPSADEVTNNELYSVLPYAANGYVNGLFSNYTEAQMDFIYTLTSGVVSLPVESIQPFILDVEDNITKSDLAFEEQIPLLMATAVGYSDVNYWLAQIAIADSAWYTRNYFSPQQYVNRSSLPYWSQAAIIGTLMGADKAKTYGLLDPPKIAGVDIVTAIMASIGVAAGKVMFGWIPRLQSVPAGAEETFLGGFSMVLGTPGVAGLAARNKTCPITNNCNAGNCVRGCGRRMD